MHKNTVQPTSYFCAPSKYDFFGGFDHGKGCGACTVACPSGAMDLSGFSNKQIMAEVDAICR